jgi:FAD/FMN-containing dehydrogenase
LATAQSTLQGELQKIVGDENTVLDPATLRGYLRDFSPYDKVTPRVVVRPSDAEEVCDVVKLARRERRKILTLGGGASFTGYLLPHPSKTIVLETTRMNRVIEVNEEDMTITAQCGVILSRLEEEAQKRGLYLHTVTTPVRFSTLGGILSGVAGGGLPLRGASVGNDMNFVLGLEVVLASGKILRTGMRGSNVNAANNFLKGGNGSDLTGLFIGDGGCFGIKTEATLQMLPERRFSEAGCWSFRDISSAWAAVKRMTAVDPLPFTQLKVRQSKTFDLSYVAEEYSKSRLELDLSEIVRSCKAAGGKKAPQEMQELARRYKEYMREDERMTSPKGMFAYFIPNSSFPAVYQEMNSFLSSRITKRRLSKLGISTISNFRPNGYTGVYVNTMILYEGGSRASRNEARRLLGEAYARVVGLGASPEPRQGNSSLDLRRGWSKEYLSSMEVLRQALDPDQILNPGVWGL